MRNNAPKQLDLRSTYAVTFITLIVFAVVIWIAASPVCSF
jgi:hypothetical protein